MAEIKEFKVEVPDGYEIDKENSTFECIKFKKKEFYCPKDWCDFCTNKISGFKCAEYPWIPSELYEYDAFVALGKLIQLRDWWWDNLCDGWRPNYTDNKPKFVIYCSTYYPKAGVTNSEHSILAFPSLEIRDKFLGLYYDLISEAKTLI